MNKENAARARGGFENGANYDYTPRQLRVLEALAIGPLHREEVDRVSGASNGPYIIGQLRAKGWMIVCEMVPHSDRDGRSGMHGVYHLETTDQQRLRGLLSQKRAVLKGVPNVE